jgi:chaperonin GroEL
MKQITLENTKQRLKNGVDKLADVVKITMGGMGKNVIIRDAVFSEVSIINDGINIAKRIELDDEVENTGAMLAKLAAYKTDEEAGDGTTTTIVLLQAYLNEMMKIKTNDQRGLRDEIKAKIDSIIEKIDKEKKQISGTDLLKVAKNSSLDDEIAEAVVEVVKKIGKNGVYDIEESSVKGIQVEVVDGIRVGVGYLTPYFINNNENGKAEFRNVPVLLVDQRIETIHELVKLMEEMIKHGKKSMVLFCKQISDDVVGFLVSNKMQGVFQCCVVKTIEMNELELVTGAKVIADNSANGFTMDSLGIAKSVSIGKKESIVSAGKNKKEINEKIVELKSQMEVADENEKTKLKKIISKLENGIATLRIGGENIQETKEKKYKLEDAMNAVMAAIDDGVVEGGGMTLYRIAEEIQGEDESSQLVREVLKAPFKQILLNGEENIEKVLSLYTLAHPNFYPEKKGFEKVSSYKNSGYGYNVVTRKWENLFKSGVIDPAKVVKCALANAFSMGNQILTVEAGIIEENPEENK